MFLLVEIKKDEVALEGIWIPPLTKEKGGALAALEMEGKLVDAGLVGGIVGSVGSVPGVEEGVETGVDGGVGVELHDLDLLRTQIIK